MQRRVGPLGEIVARQVGHVGVVAALAARVDRAPALVAAEVAVERRADVIKLVKESDELVVEILVEETRQAKRHHVEHLLFADKVALHLIGGAAPSSPRQVAVAEAQGRHACLQAVRPIVAGLGRGKQEARYVDMPKRFTSSHDIRA